MPTAEEELTALARRRIGTFLLGKYRLDRVLAVGGMAVVYKATHRNEAEFAVKMLHPELSLREAVRTRFRREGKAANSVKHPGVVLVVDDDVAEDGAAFLVMELLHGMSVEDVWARTGGRLPVQAALSVGVQLLDVLAAAHAKEIVHRDIKPDNLFATRDGTLKVLDFGIARVKDATAAGGKGTGTGITLGTPAFMAPEQAYARANEVDGRTDLWAVGATLFTLLTGQSVHEGENAAELVIRAATTRARPLASLAGDLPAGIAAVVDRALAYDKSARWPDAEAMRVALEDASIEAFGATPSKSTLAALVPADSLPPNPDFGPEASLPDGASGAGHEGSRLGATVTTAELPSGGPTQVIDRVRMARSRRRAWAVAGIASLASVAFALAWVMKSDAPPLVHVAPAAVAASPPPIAAPAATIPPDPTPSSAPVVPSASASIAPSPPSRSVAPTCTVVTSYDTQGRPHFKKVCK